MRSTLLGSLFFFLLLSTASVWPTKATEWPETPTAAKIEDLLRETLAKSDTGQLWLLPYQAAVLEEFQLIDVTPVTRTRWQAEIELRFDYGPRPPAVLGFERRRSGTFRMVIERRNGAFELIRFYPAARRLPLPA